MAEANLSQLMQSAVRLQLQGKLPEARDAYEQILARDPHNSEAMNLLGVIYCSLGERNRGLALINKSIALEPNNAQRYCNLAYAHCQLGEFDQAISAYGKALELKPDFFEAHYSLGLALFRIGQTDSAITHYRAALSIRSGAFNACHELGVALRQQGKLDESIAVLREAIDKRLRRIKTLEDQAKTLRDRGQLNESDEASKAAVGAAPGLASAYNTLGASLVAKGNLDEALHAIRKSIEISPNDAAYRCNLASVLKDTGQIEQAEKSYAAAIALDPENPVIHSNWLYVMHFHPDYDAAKILAEARQWNARHAVPLASHRKAHENDRSPDRPLRIGFVSPDFRSHAVGRSLLALMRHHDRAQFQFYCFSDVAHPDSITTDLKNLSEHWRQTYGFSHARLCETIRQDRIDILFDLTLHMNGNRMLAFAAKPAPVQITWAGYPGTTCLDTMDYRLTDPHLDPPGETDLYYSERSLRLPASFWCLDEQTLDSPHTPAVSPLPALQNSRINFGCLNNFAKVNQKTLNLWRTVLDAVANSRLIVLAPPGSARDWFRKSLGERVEFVQRQPQEAYLKAYNDIDIGLDTFPYTGHMTTLDSLWMGVPVVSLTGNTAVSRGGASILRNLTLPDLVASSQDQFATIATGLAEDLPRLPRCAIQCASECAGLP